MSVAIGVIAGVFGLCIGSFLNVVVYRVPRGLSIVQPPSACPNCHHDIRSRDNIPVVSWLLLRGKCRDCAHPISVRYPLVEVTTGVLFVGVVIRLGRSWSIPAYCALMAGMLALALIDLEFHKLPKRVVWIHLAIVAALLTLAAGLESGWHHLLVGVVAALIWSAVFFVINFLSPRLLGFGDVRVSLVLGLSLGYLGAGSAVLGFFAANLVGLIVSLVLIALKRTTRDQEIPYGIYLAVGAAIAVYFGPVLLAPFPRP